MPSSNNPAIQSPSQIDNTQVPTLGSVITAALDGLTTASPVQAATRAKSGAGVDHPTKKTLHVLEFDGYGLPLTLLDWRRLPKAVDGTTEYVWGPLEGMFGEHGLVLFKANAPELRNYGLLPKKPDEIRAPDKYHEVYTAETRPKNVPLPHYSNKCWPATRVRDGTHVMIQLVCKGEEGQIELEILRRFSRPDIAFHPDNHIIHLLDEVAYLDMVFAVCPLLRENIMSPWYYDVREVLDAVCQAFKALAFMHENLVAHMDIGPHDILMNYGGKGGRREFTRACFDSLPFRSLLSGPCRYTFIDFELGVIFPRGSKQERCRISGMQILKSKRLTDPKQYGKTLCPEWITPGHYSPFKSDVFQIGHMFGQILWEMPELLPELAQILDDMIVEDPDHRPTMAEASKRVERYRKNLDEATLSIKFRDYCNSAPKPFTSSDWRRVDED